MATVGETTRPGYVYDSATDVWIPVGIGPHSHTPAAIGAISSSLVTTKGDLIVATGSGTVVRQGVGADGSYLVADSTQADGVTWAGPSNMAGRNAVLNSNMSVWQRGTSVAVTTTSYTADRWFAYRNAAGATVSRQATSDTTNLPNIQYCLRFQRDSGNTSTSIMAMSNNFETINSIPFAGKTVTLSFYARIGANFSNSGNTISFKILSGTGVDQNSTLNYTGVTTVATIDPALTTTWQRFSCTGTVPTTATEIAIQVGNWTPTGTAGAADYVEFTGVQLEHGSVATPYAPNGATYQAELAACQRYYWRTAAPSAEAPIGAGAANATTTCFINVNHPVSMRVAPTAIDYSGIFLSDLVSGFTTFTNFTINQAQTNTSSLYGIGFTGLTQYRGLYLRTTTTAGYLGLSAEL